MLQKIRERNKRREGQEEWNREKIEIVKREWEESKSKWEEKENEMRKS